MLSKIVLLSIFAVIATVGLSHAHRIGVLPHGPECNKTELLQDLAQFTSETTTLDLNLFSAYKVVNAELATCSSLATAKECVAGLPAVVENLKRVVDVSKSYKADMETLVPKIKSDIKKCKK